jgi:hypothetical protein
MADKDPQGRGPSEDSRTKGKKSYKAPVLIEWGSLMDLTQSNGQSGHPDGGHNRYASRTG